MVFAGSGMTSETHRAIDAVWRIESPRLIAGLARFVRDVGLAEDLAQDALVAALEQWPQSGVPDKPGAWLMAVAKRRAIDLRSRYAPSMAASIRAMSSSRIRRGVTDRRMMTDKRLCPLQSSELRRASPSFTGLILMNARPAPSQLNRA